MDLVKFYNLFIECDFQFTTDSRAVKKGDIFFALKGERFNGNKYAMQTIEDGASYAVVDEHIGSDPRLVYVDDVLRFMQDLAHFHRSCFDIPILGICGSNGKTTSKNLIYSVLAQQFKTHCTLGNFNNHIGVPITLLQMPQDTEIGIIELGTNSPGEIAELCGISDPNYGLITNIGKEHLEGFGTLEAVAKEESEIYVHLLKNKGTAFVNADDEWLMRMSRGIANKVLHSKEDTVVHQLVPYLKFSYKGLDFESPLMGDYNLDNILLAIAIGEHFGMDIQTIRSGIQTYEPDNNRSQLLQQNSNTILLDAYNANPSSMQVAIANFCHMPQDTKVLVLGDMLEMGENANQEHLELLEWSISQGFEHIYLKGAHFSAISEKVNIKTYPNIEELGKAIQSKKFSNAAFLVKGSRGMKMEGVLDYL